ncbi:hypothetical protein ES708_17074 [subsurface metagenome]
MAIITTLTAIIAIAGLTGYALSLHIDGVLLAGSVAILAGLGGYAAPHRKKKEE